MACPLPYAEKTPDPGMPHLHRFYTGPFPQSAPLITLREEEAHHALRVVRVREGDHVALFDGHGREFTGAVQHCTRHEVQVEVQETRLTDRPLPELTLAFAWLHQDKAIEFIIRHGTELGVARFIFFRAARSERPPKLNDKWQRLAIEVCKQSGRLWLPEFTLAKDLSDTLDGLEGQTFFGALDPPHAPLQLPPAASRINLLIGPEGDFTQEEVAVAKSKSALPVSLGQTIFKAEMAALVAITLLQHQAGHLGLPSGPIL